MNENLLVNIGELSKPANTLIIKISNAVGGIFKPYQIKRIAKAEAAANLIYTINDIEVKELTQRAMNRFVEEETKRQKNIENITAKAIPLLNTEAASEDIEDDWITNFFDKCRIVSDKEMQEIWSKVLAGEANKINTYSKRTVNLLASLDKRDAELFTKLCTYGWFMGDISPIIFDCQNKIYTQNGITFSSLTHLDSIGLITFDNISGYTRCNLPKKTKYLYYGKPFCFEFKKNNDNIISIGKVLLTQAGQELAKICNSSPNEKFLQYSLNNWERNGIFIKRIFD